MGRQQDPEGGDNSVPDEVPKEEEAVPAEVRLLRAVLGSSLSPKHELSIYDGSLKAENLIYWISDMEKCFEHEKIDENKGVKFAVTRLKGHTTLWWDNVQDERRKKDKPLIKS